jgi:hypothetical protein
MCRCYMYECTFTTFYTLPAIEEYRSIIRPPNQCSQVGAIRTLYLYSAMSDTSLPI